MGGNPGTHPGTKYTNIPLTRRYLVDMGGDQVTELDGTGAWQHSNIWAGGKLVATYDAKGIHFALSDPLGTKRVQANAAGQVDESCTGLPFGNDLGNPTSLPCAQTANALATNDDATEHHFTQKERDAESGNDYFLARYYSSAMGRFMSPDWSAKETPVPYAVFTDPQSLNLYAYVRNNPLTRVDADGHCNANDWGCNPWSSNNSNNNWNTLHQIQNPAAQQQNTQTQDTQPADNTLLAQNQPPPPPGRTPVQGQPPDSTVTIPDGKGGSTERTFGPDGKAVKDIDRGHDHGAGDPHAHDWDWTKNRPRQPGRPLTPEEQQNLKRTAGGVSAGVIIYWIISEATRLFPPAKPHPSAIRRSK